MAHTTGQMAGSTKATGMMESNMVKENSLTAKENVSTGSGKMVKENIG